MTTYDISEVAQRTGLSSATLRFYEAKGLIKPIGRQGLKRVYHADTLTRLSLILLAKQAQFSLKEMVPMLAQIDQGLNRSLINSKVEELALRIQELTQLQALLQHIQHCPERNHFDCPNFQRILQNAVSQNLSDTTP